MTGRGTFWELGDCGLKERTKYLKKGLWVLAGFEGVPGDEK